MILWKFGFAILMLSVTSFANQTIAIEVHHTNLHGDSPATALKDFAAQVETKNPAEQKAAERLRSMAEQGNIKAQYNLGVRGTGRGAV
jgi:hypothetical protein